MTTLERPGNVAFRVERRGTQEVPRAEQHVRPHALAALWSGSSINIAYVIYGALLMGFGFSLERAVVLIVLGNASYVLVGLASLQGPTARTTTFAISRAAFGVRGARAVALLNWVTQLGFETTALVLIQGAALTLLVRAGWHVGTAGRVGLVVAAVAAQSLLPIFGHATMVRVLRWMIVPFAVVFALLSVAVWGHGSVVAAGGAGGWPLDSAGLAFVVALSGLGWTECANDYSRYLDPGAPARRVVGGVVLGAAVPETLLMALGAFLYTRLPDAAGWASTNPFDVLVHPHLGPTWLVTAVLVVAIVQLLAIDALVLYSSGVSLQAAGLSRPRVQTVMLDAVLAGALTLWATFQSSFSLFTKEFVGVIIVWISPWLGVFLTDWALRRGRYDAAALQRADAGSPYYGGRRGLWPAAAVAFVAGLVAATACFSKAPPPVSVPWHWMTPVANHFGAFYCPGTLAAHCGAAGWLGGADLSAPAGILVSAAVYAALAHRRIRAARAC